MTGASDERLFEQSDVVVWSSKALSAEIDGEIVALDVENGVCYGLDCIGARIWAILQVPTSVRALLAALTAEFDVDPETCHRDVIDLLADLRGERLIALHSSGVSPEFEV
jgi:hypothetical protein